MGKLQRGICNFIFLIKAFLAIVLGSAALGYNGFVAYSKYTNAFRGLSSIYFPPVGSKDASQCYFNSSTKSRLEPPPGAFFFGFSPDWTDGKNPQDIANRLGYTPPLWNTFVTLTASDYEAKIIEWNCQVVKSMGGVLELSVIPDMKASEIPESFYSSFASFLRVMNSKYGVPILLRFMPEMNGYWMKYGWQPIDQIESWRKLTIAIRAQTNLTAMVWSPNIAASYGSSRPNQDSRILAKDFSTLDTNNDNIVDKNDDPFEPYYPGDEYVDWIGISVYNYDRTSRNQVAINKPDVFTNPNANQATETLFDRAHPFYPTYVTGKNKPFIFSETAAPIETNLPGNISYVQIQPTPQYELQVKQAWWRAIFATALGPGAAMPKLKAVVWFEITKPEQAYNTASNSNNNNNVLRDYTVTTNRDVASALAADVKGYGNQMTYPGKFKFSCNGEWNNV